MRLLARMGFALVLSAMPAIAGDNEDGMRFLQNQDYAQAINSFRKAALRGDASAQASLGVMYDEGQGVAKDYKQALSWYKKAAAQGNAPGQNNLGTMYNTGQGVAQDYKQAMSWYGKAAAQGYAPAQFNLGIMYATGRGTLRDYVEAHKWLSLSGANGQENATKYREMIEKNMTRERIAEAQRRASEWLKAHGK